MGDATSEAVQRFFRDALERVDRAEGLAELIEPLVGQRFSRQTVTAWARGDGRPLAHVVFATAKVLGLSLDSYIQDHCPEESIRAAIARIDDTLGELVHGLGLADTIPAPHRPATKSMPDLLELVREIRELQERQEDRERHQTG